MNASRVPRLLFDAQARYPYPEGPINLQPDGQTRRLYPLYSLPVWQHGKGWVFPLYKRVLHVLDWHPGELLIARIHAPYITFRVARPERIIPIDNFGPEVLPPTWPGKTDNATSPDNSESATRPAAQSHEGDDH